MKLKIYHPSILVVLLMMIAALSSSAILLANQGEELPTKSLSIPTAPITTTLSKEEREDAIRIVKTSGVVESINGNQNWEADWVLSTKIAGTEGVRLEALWSEPVESSGPWSLMPCNGTLKTFTKERWSQIRRLVVFVDMEAEAVAGYGVTSQKEDVPQPTYDLDPDETVKLYDVETGDIIYEGSPSDVPSKEEVCADGTFYRD